MAITTRNIVLLPNDEVAEQARSLSRQAAQRYETSFVLNDQRCLPHLTLHQFAIPTENLSKLEQAIDKVARATEPFEVAMLLAGPFGDGGIWWDAHKNSGPLWQLHRELVETVVPLQENYLLPHLIGIATGEIKASDQERFAYRLYGNPWANPVAPDFPYRPHITITKLRNVSAVEDALSTTIRPASMKFIAEEVHMTELGENGTCPGPLRTFSLAT